MAVRLDHIGAIVDDLDTAVAFFSELGLEVEGSAPIEGPWVEAVNAIEGLRVDVVMMRTPDGQGRLELTKFRHPPVIRTEPEIMPPNTLGYRQVMFQVDDIEDTVERLRGHGGTLIGEIAQYEDIYRVCYMHGPAGMIVALAQDLR